MGLASLSAVAFEDGSFDGVMAATSIEQTPDPREALRKIYRVLRPGGHLRLDYEGLGYYRRMMREDRPTSLEAVIQLLSPLVQVIVEMPAPISEFAPDAARPSAAPKARGETGRLAIPPLGSLLG